MWPLNADDDASLHMILCGFMVDWDRSLQLFENSDIQVTFLRPSGPRTIFHWPEGKTLAGINCRTPFEGYFYDQALIRVRKFVHSEYSHECHL